MRILALGLGIATISLVLGSAALVVQAKNVRSLSEDTALLTDATAVQKTFFWEVPVGTEPGQHQVVVKAVDSAGNEAEQVVTIEVVEGKKNHGKGRNTDNCGRKGCKE